MRSGSPTRTFAAVALLALAAVAPGCGRPSDEAWLRFLGFKDGDSTLTVLEGELNDGKTDYADAAFSNTSVIVGTSGGGAGTGILVKSARVDYRMSGYSPPSADYPLNLYLGPSSHTNGTATADGTTEAQTSFPLATASLKQWLINTGAFNDSSATPTVKLTADVTFFAETDEGVELEVNGSITILLTTSGSGGGAGAQTVNIAATVATATIATPGKFTVTRDGSRADDLTVDYSTYGGTATAGEDYTELDGYVVIPAGSTSASITVTPLSGFTAGRTVIVTLEENSEFYTVGGRSKATIIITD